MKWNSRQTTIAALRITLGLLLLWRSAVLLFHQWTASGPLQGIGIHVAYIAIGEAEVVAAVLFLVPRTLLFGAYGLLAVFLAAGGLHVLHREFDVMALLVVWAVAVLTVVAHRRTGAMSGTGGQEAR